MNTQHKEIKLYIDTPYWYIRQKNTDWQYTLSLQGMMNHAPLLTYYSQEHKLMLVENYHWLERKFLKSKHLPLQRTLKSSTLLWCNPDIIYSHGKLPITSTRTPTAWLYGVVDPNMRIKSGVPTSTIEAEYKRIEPSFDRATVVLCPTKAFAYRHRERFPKFAEKFQYAPFFLNHIEAITESECISKHSNEEEIRLLFVGREAYRKGLDIVLEAFNKISHPNKKNIKLHVITDKNYTANKYGKSDSVVWHQEMPRAEITKLMRASHIFIMPSRFESYGFVYIEAMAAGCAVIAASWESQREIFDQGRAGILVNSDLNNLSRAIALMLKQKERIEIALNGLRKYKKEYIPEVVSMRHYKIFSSII